MINLEREYVRMEYQPKKRKRYRLFAPGMTAILMACCAELPINNSNQNLDSTVHIRVLRSLSSDQMQGRKTGTEGHRKAKEYLLNEINAMGVFDDIRTQDFEFTYNTYDEATDTDLPVRYTGTNLIGLIDSEDNDEGPLLVITAHYDHLGVHKGKIYNGADDNASGSAALFAIAEAFRESPPRHDVLFVWLDAEEMGLSGAEALLDAESNFEGRAVFNLNLDMISQNEKEIYLAGSYHTPALKPLIIEAAKDIDIKVSFGHDTPEEGNNDWTYQSDHGAFFERGIPFAYFGVEDHKHYHNSSDKFETIPLDFYENSVKLIVSSAQVLDRNLNKLAKIAK